MLKLLWKKGFLPMRPTWKGSISFGLVYIPVAVYPATREEKISFRQLRSSDLSPIRYKKVAEADSKEVPADQIVKAGLGQPSTFAMRRSGPPWAVSPAV